MANICPKCHEEADIFHSCSTSTEVLSGNFSGISYSEPQALFISIIAAAPLMGIFLDYLLPLPSSLLLSSLLSLVGSALVAIIWVSFSYRGTKSLRFFLRNLKNFLFTPNILKIFTTINYKKSRSTWLLSMLLVSLFQLAFFTPGNAHYLANRVSSQIEKSSGANLSAECPNNKFYLYNSNITCRVKIKVLGLSTTVPARAKLSPFLGNSTIKVSLR